MNSSQSRAAEVKNKFSAEECSNSPQQPDANAAIRPARPEQPEKKISASAKKRIEEVSCRLYGTFPSSRARWIFLGVGFSVRFSAAKLLFSFFLFRDHDRE